MKKKYIILLLFFVPCIATADTYWVSTTGAANWASAQSETPLSGTACTDVRTAFQTASGNDLVYLRNGTYDLGSTYPNNYVETANNGTDDSNRVVVTAYNGESVTITSDVSGTVGSDHGGVINIRNTYWTIHHISIVASNLGSKEGAAAVMIGYIGTGDYFYIHDCTIEVEAASGNSFQGVIELFGTGNVIEHNEIIGVNNNECIQQWASSSVKILNNVIHGGRDGIFYKHPNCDSSLSDGAEIAYNYLYDFSRLGICGNFSYVNIHDNIMDGFRIGDDGGEQPGCTTRLGSVINHNTIIGTVYDYGDIVYTADFNNNIVTSGLSNIDTEMMTMDYNMYGSAAAIGAHDIGNTSPTFVGGANPSTISGFALTSESAGYQYAADGSDIGADVTLVGINATGEPTPSQSGVTMSGVTIGQ
jgi:hypothetical protein